MLQYHISSHNIHSKCHLLKWVRIILLSWDNHNSSIQILQRLVNIQINLTSNLTQIKVNNLHKLYLLIQINSNNSSSTNSLSLQINLTISHNNNSNNNPLTISHSNNSNSNNNPLLTHSRLLGIPYRIPNNKANYCRIIRKYLNHMLISHLKLIIVHRWPLQYLINIHLTTIILWFLIMVISTIKVDRISHNKLKTNKG